MNEHESEFDDPGLREAIRRTVTREVAPASLRAKVTALLAAEAAAAAAPDAADAGHATAPDPRPRRRRLVIDRNFWKLSALAACVMLAVGFAAYQVREAFFPPSHVYTGATVIPETFVGELVKTHDRCAKLPDHHLIPGDDPEALRETLTLKGGVAASATHLSAGWQFKGAGICSVGGRDAAHLLFVRGNDHVSIFSMPAPEGCGYGVESYKQIVDKHAVAGFTRGGALYCVVGSRAAGGGGGAGEFTLAEIEPVLQQVRESVAMGGMGCVITDTVAAGAAAADSQQHHH